MELILKRPRNKPPFIGILFQDEYEASTLNQSWVNSYNTYLYNITLEPDGKEITLKLSLDGYGLNHRYKNLRHDPEKLYRFLYETKAHGKFNFAHLIMVRDKHTVVSTTVNRALFVLGVKKVTLLIEE